MSRSIVRRLVVLGTAGAATFALAACGASGAIGSSSSVSRPSSATTSVATKATESEVFLASTAAAKAATSAHLNGTFMDSGQQRKLDIIGTVDGTDAAATVDSGAQGVVTIVTVGAKVYMRADVAFWKSVGAKEGAPAGKWVLTPPKFVKAMPDTTIKGFLASVYDSSDVATLKSSTTAAQVQTVDGKQAYVLTDAAGGTLYIDAATKLPFKLVGPTSDPQTLTLTEWGTAKAPTAPPANEVIDLSAIK